MERGFTRLVDEFPLVPGAARFTAAGTYDKLGLLVVLALVTGSIGYFTANTGLLILGMIGGLVFSLVGIFKPRLAKIMAPLYALSEGLALGAITAYFATGNNGLVPLAIIFTAGVFLAALVIFRSGLVKVTPRFVSMAVMAAVGFLFVWLAVAFGLSIPGLGGSGTLALMGVFGVAIGIMFLFVDFNFVYQSERLQLPAEGEWLGALLLMTSLVMVYINIVRILGRRR